GDLARRGEENAVRADSQLFDVVVRSRVRDCRADAALVSIQEVQAPIPGQDEVPGRGEPQPAGSPRQGRPERLERLGGKELDRVVPRGAGQPALARMSRQAADVAAGRVTPLRLALAWPLGAGWDEPGVYLPVAFGCGKQGGPVGAEEHVVHARAVRLPGE